MIDVAVPKWSYSPCRMIRMTQVCRRKWRICPKFSFVNGLSSRVIRNHRIWENSQQLAVLECWWKEPMGNFSLYQLRSEIFGYFCGYDFAKFVNSRTAIQYYQTSVVTLDTCTAHFQTTTAARLDLEALTPGRPRDFTSHVTQLTQPIDRRGADSEEKQTRKTRFWRDAQEPAADQISYFPPISQQHTFIT